MTAKSDAHESIVTVQAVPTCFRQGPQSGRVRRGAVPSAARVLVVAEVARGQVLDRAAGSHCPSVQTPC